MKILSKDFHARMGNLLNDEMKKLGFKRLKSNPLSWTKEELGQYLTIWLQCDKWGWEDCFGSSFTLEFQLSEAPTIGSGSLERRARLGDLIPVDDLSLLRSLNNAVLMALPTAPPSHNYYKLSERQRNLIYRKKKPSDIPYALHEDIWLHYFTFEDIEIWGRYFRERIPSMLHSYLFTLQKNKAIVPTNEIH